MQFLTSLFGGSGNTIITTAFALGIVLVLIVLGVWMLKVFFKASTNIGRGRNRRLSVVDHMQIDARRQLLIIRRDNVEHLILTGGAHDVVVETGIPVERSALPVRRQSTDPAAANDLAQSAPGTPSSAGGKAAGLSALRPHVERLRDFARDAVPRKSPSLRHTGLMRPISQGEPAVIPMPPIAGDKSDRAKPDSATTPLGTETKGQIKFGATRFIGDGSKAD